MERDPEQAFLKSIQIALAAALVGLMALALCSCGALEIPNQDTHVDEALAPDVAAFMQECADRGMADLCNKAMRKVAFVRLLPENDPALVIDGRRVGGRCVYADAKRMDPAEVYIGDYSFSVWGWGLVYHELGHCVLGIKTHPETIQLMHLRQWKGVPEPSDELLNQLFSGAYLYGSRTPDNAVDAYL